MSLCSQDFVRYPGLPPLPPYSFPLPSYDEANPWFRRIEPEMKSPGPVPDGVVTPPRGQVVAQSSSSIGVGVAPSTKERKRCRSGSEDPGRCSKRALLQGISSHCPVDVVALSASPVKKIQSPKTSFMRETSREAWPVPDSFSSAIHLADRFHQVFSSKIPSPQPPSLLLHFPLREGERSMETFYRTERYKLFAFAVAS